MTNHRNWLILERRRLLAEEGSASLEFLSAGLLLLVPLVYLVVSLAQLQAGVFAVEGAARNAARAFVLAPSSETASHNVESAIRLAFEDYGLEFDSAEIAIECSPTPRECRERRGFVTVSVETVVDLSLAPYFLASGLPLSIPVHATATQQVSRFAVTEDAG